MDLKQYSPPLISLKEGENTFSYLKGKKYVVEKEKKF
jgi:hypothetical protein